MNVSNELHDGECPYCGHESDRIIIVGDDQKSPTYSVGGDAPVDVRTWACQYDGETYLHREIHTDHIEEN